MKADLELTAAHRDLLSLDLAIDELCKKFADDFEDREDFVDAEERRFAALECLATIRAGSPEGMVAKARAIKTLSLAEDPDRRVAIAGSLADDVLRYFGGKSVRGGN